MSRETDTAGSCAVMIGRKSVSSRIGDAHWTLARPAGRGRCHRWRQLWTSGSRVFRIEDSGSELRLERIRVVQVPGPDVNGA